MAQAPFPFRIVPPDAHNLELAENVHPARWTNPEPARRYNLVVIGAGTAGLVTAAGAAGLGAKVALVERNLMGGDCLNFGCVPSKALIRAARAAAEIRRARAMGIEAGVAAIDFARVMERMRRLRAELSRNDSAARFSGLGVDVFFGDARFAARDRVAVDGKTLVFRRAAIATGARPAAPPIAGLAEAGYLTNETVFSLTELPRRLAVIGGGPIGCELAQAFARFGAQVTILEAMPRILNREDSDAAELVRAALVRDGVEIAAGCGVARIEKRNGERLIEFIQDGAQRRLVADEILLGAGRLPNIDGMGLEAAGVEYDRQAGVRVNDRLQTSNPRIYAAGDVCTTARFTHMADAMARIVIRNALFFGRARASALAIPSCTYTDPEIAHVGIYESEAAARGIALRTFVRQFAEVDRAVLDGDTEGFARAHVLASNGRIAGATIAGRHASEMISEVAVAMSAGMTLGALAGVIHPYPTHAEALRHLGDAYNRARLTPSLKRLFERWFRLSR
jgi:pyruvate/2-oxoglutarate dehydrogenase complex dihydrolipoamide dehydrogenase (E3) component